MPATLLPSKAWRSCPAQRGNVAEELAFSARKTPNPASLRTCPSHRPFRPSSHQQQRRASHIVGIGNFLGSFNSKKEQSSKHDSDAAGGPLPHAPAHFDLPLAVVLAGAAFESYLEPQGGEGFQQRTAGGPAVTYTDKAFLTEAYTGVLQLTLDSAANLRPADPNGLSDPYAVVSVANCSWRSATQPATLNPAWEGEVHCMYIRNPATDIVRIRLYDADLAKSDEDLGLAMLGLGAVAGEGAKGRPHTLTLPLRGAGAGNGATVTVTARYLAFEDADPAAVAALTTQRTTAPSPSALAGVQAAAAAVAAAAAAMRGDTGDEKAAEGQGPKEDAAAAAQEELGSGATISLPGGEEVPNPWRVLAAMAGRAAGAGGGGGGALTPVAFVENEETDTQVWLYRNVERREAVVAFRGTEQIKWKDLATDLNLTPASFNPERIDDNAGLPFTARIFRAVSGKNQDQMMVHKGFLDAYDSVRRSVMTLLDAITGAGDKGGVWRVYVTGHSLGGALATLAAYELADRRTPARSAQAISLYSYGAPRVGNKVFAESLDRLVPDTWRITNSNDIIPSVPRLMGYCHVGHAVRLGAGGELAVGRSAAASTDVFGEGKAGAEVIASLVQQVREEGVPLDEVYATIAEREMALLDALVGGKGLEEHMETFYLASLQQAVSSLQQAKAEQAAGAAAAEAK